MASLQDVVIIRHTYPNSHSALTRTHPDLYLCLTVSALSLHSLNPIKLLKLCQLSLSTFSLAKFCFMLPLRSSNLFNAFYVSFSVGLTQLLETLSKKLFVFIVRCRSMICIIHIFRSLSTLAFHVGIFWQFSKSYAPN